VSFTVSLPAVTLPLLLAVALVAGCQSSSTAPAASPVPSVGTPVAAQRPHELAQLRAVVGERSAALLSVDRAAGAARDERDEVGADALDVLLARTPDEQQRGLQGVTELPDGIGMLFVHAAPAGPSGRPGFWMLGTPLPLDIAFLVGDVRVGAAEVIAVATMTPCAQLPCPITHPGVAYDAALEVRAGGLAAAGIRVGSFVRWQEHTG
jgi:uncharacterized membrane protein (UPF0127 family)